MYGSTQASTSRRAGIPVQQPRQGQTGQSGLLKSSLDIVWSYSRSQAFFGSNLPSSPSFVARYRRPGGSDTDEESGLPRRHSSPGRIGDATTTEEDELNDDDEDDYIEEEDEDEDNDQDLSLRLDDNAQAPTEPLPPNALSPLKIAQAKSRRRRSSARRKSRVSALTAARSRPRTPSPALSDQAALHEASTDVNIHTPPLPFNHEATVDHATPISERTPLLTHIAGSLRPLEVEQSPYASSPPDNVPFPRRSSNLRKRRKSNARLQKEKIAPQGLSTSGQTLFNAINVLVGIGILAQPLAFAQAGWVLGTIILLFCGAITNYTAKILARILAEDHRLMTYADIGAKAFGSNARNFINVLFCLEITALCVALLILLGDSLSILLPLSANSFKLVGFAIILPTLFLPLRYLSVASLIGIISVVVLTITVFADGFIAPSQPGSLIHPMPTSIGPQWRQLPLAFGLFMSGYGGHAVFPSLARDIRDPTQFNRVCNQAFIIATSFYLFMGTIGYLMFGHGVTDEVTRDVLRTKGLPRSLNIVAVCMVAITPVCKYAISSTPLEGTISWLLGVNESSSRIQLHSGSSIQSEDEPTNGSASFFSDSHINNSSTPKGSALKSVASRSSIIQPLADIQPRSKVYVRQVVKVATSVLVLVIAIFVPSFDKVIGLLGAFTVFTICAIGPIGANLSLHRKSMSQAHIAMDVALLLISVCMAIVGTVFIFLPQ